MENMDDRELQASDGLTSLKKLITDNVIATIMILVGGVLLVMLCICCTCLLCRSRNQRRKKMMKKHREKEAMEISGPALVTGAAVQSKEPIPLVAEHIHANGQQDRVAIGDDIELGNRRTSLGMQGVTPLPGMAPATPGIDYVQSQIIPKTLKKEGAAQPVQNRELQIVLQITRDSQSASPQLGKSKSQKERVKSQKTMPRNAHDSQHDSLVNSRVEADNEMAPFSMSLSNAKKENNNQSAEGSPKKSLGRSGKGTKKRKNTKKRKVKKEGNASTQHSEPTDVEFSDIGDVNEPVKKPRLSSGLQASGPLFNTPVQQYTSASSVANPVSDSLMPLPPVPPRATQLVPLDQQINIVDNPKFEAQLKLQQEMVTTLRKKANGDKNVSDDEVLNSEKKKNRMKIKSARPSEDYLKRLNRDSLGSIFRPSADFLNKALSRKASKNTKMTAVELAEEEI